MILRKKYAICLALLVLGFSIFTSCVYNKTISIQTLKPAELSVPSNFAQPLIVTGIYKGVPGSPESMAQAALDSTAALEAGLVLAETLAESPWFQGVEPPVRQHYRDESTRLILPYSWNEVENMASATDADLVISLEYIKITPKTDSYPYWDGAFQGYYGYLSMDVYAYWRVYDLYNRELVSNYLFRDTLIWDEYDYFPVEVGDQLPGFFNSAAYCGYLVGDEYAKKIAPYWADEQRFYYVKGHKLLRNAANLVINNQWEDAANLWQEVIDKYPNREELAAKAAFNLALANEMLGNFDVAIDWLEESEKYYRLQRALVYKSVLKERIKHLEKL
ncbi:MAG: DUF6340 family protein [Bacteroidales bacterium]|nr:DUF6340 family protein [Bacteroidales bacterium]MDD4671901.1 DUF6340 family protein [Bacteroidales bacterium]MDY0348679.1 DUF6340 family protein [Tenuifilaceae bacterium]